MASNSTVQAQDILHRMRVPGRQHVYVLGCFEKRVTLYTQQVRALNLIFALNQEFKKSGSRVAVIGAGAGGITAAAAAAVCGCSVSVFDMRSSPLGLIGSSRQRWLHPHIYEWPKENSENRSADLPFLDWNEAEAYRVADDLRESWRKLVDSYKINVHCNVQMIAVEPFRSGKSLLRWNGQGPNWPPGNTRGSSGYKTWSVRPGHRMRMEPFDVVVLAVGFGEETTTKGFSGVNSYWMNDNIDSDDLRTKKATNRVLVSGTGDGGLIDVLRYSFRNFRHELILKQFKDQWLLRPDIEVVKSRILEIEESAWSSLAAREPYLSELNLSYRELADSLVLKSDIELRTNIETVLTGKESLPLDLDSAPINRLFFSLTNAEYIPGPISRAVKSQEDGRFTVTFARGFESEFDNVVIRHGPLPALEQYFPEIWNACEELREKARSTPDPTREPLNYEKFYEERLRLAAKLLKPESVAQPVEIEIALTQVAIPTVNTPALDRYREALRNATLRLPENE